MNLAKAKLLPFLKVALFTLLLMLAACGSKVERLSDEVMENTYHIISAGSLRIRNGAGSVSIRGADTSELRLRAIKKARTAAQLKGIGINVAAQRDSLSITTNFLREKNKALSIGTGTVEYTLVVPQTIKIARLEMDDGKILIENMRGDEVRANLADGQMVIRNCFGKVHLAVANGALDLVYDRDDRQQFSVDAQVTNGNVRVFIPRNASYHLRAETVTGEITNDFGKTVELNGSAGRKLNMLVGKEGASPVTIRVTTGDVKITEPKTDDGTGSRDGSN